MRVSKLMLVLFILASFYFLVAKDYLEFQNSYRDINAQKAKRIMTIYPSLTVIDISGTYNMGHIPGSVNYFIGDGSFDDALTELDKNGRYLIYYHSDKISRIAARKLADAGFKKVYRLEGNYNSWVGAGFEIES